MKRTILQSGLLILATMISQFTFAQKNITKNGLYTDDQLKSMNNGNYVFKSALRNPAASNSTVTRSTLPTIMSCDTLSTTFAGGNGQDGNMFTVKALHNITISYFEGNINGNGYIKIYSKSGSFVGSEAIPANWTFVDSVNVTSAGNGVPSLLNILVNKNMIAGDTVSFYITGNGSGATVNYTNGTTQGAILSLNADLQVFQGIGLAYSFGSTYTPRLWNGIIHYCDSGSVPPPATLFSAAPVVICPGDTILFKDNSALNPTSWNWSFPGGTPSASTQQNPAVRYLTPGNYSVSLTTSNSSGSSTMTKTNYISVIDRINTSPVLDNFEASGFPSPDFFIFDDAKDGMTWARDTVASGFGNGKASVYFDNFNFSVDGTKDAIRSERIDFTWSVSPKLFFDVAYSPYSASLSDTLAIYASDDCEKNFTLLYLKGGTKLSADSSLATSLFVPSATQWRTDTVDLSAYIGKPNVILSFENRAHYGNALYLDNINVTSNTGIAEQKNNIGFFVSPNPVSQNAAITVAIPGIQNKSAIPVKMFDVLGNEIMTLMLKPAVSGKWTLNFDRGNLSGGMYYLRINEGDIRGSAKIVIE